MPRMIASIKFPNMSPLSLNGSITKGATQVKAQSVYMGWIGAPPALVRQARLLPSHRHSPLAITSDELVVRNDARASLVSDTQEQPGPAMPDRPRSTSLSATGTGRLFPGYSVRWSRTSQVPAQTGKYRPSGVP